MEQKKRDVSIDIAKGILGILVIFGHMFGGMTGVQAVMHPLLLPSFFMISGLMMRMTGEAKRPFPGILLKRTILQSCHLLITADLFQAVPVSVSRLRRSVWKAM